LSLRILPSAARSVSTRDTTLPPSIPGVGFRQTLGNGEAVGIGFERGFRIAPRLLHAADPFVADRQIALPVGIAGVGFGQPPGNGEAVGIGFEPIELGYGPMQYLRSEFQR